MQQSESTPSPEGLDDVTRLYKAAQVGRCINSVTHDINNYLGAMMSYAELIALDEETGNESHRMASEIVSAVQKCSQILSTVTAIARKERPNTTLGDPEKLVDRVVALCAYDLKLGRITLKQSQTGTAGSLLMDEPKLIRLLLQLISNAMERVSGSARKEIELGILGQADAVEIAVSDTGPPVEEGTVLFEPTLEDASSNPFGLGLYVAREYARYHSGELSYDTERGFVLRLPRENSLEA